MTKRFLKLALGAAFASVAHAADWQPLPPLPEPNGGFVCGVAKGKILLVGGTNWEGGKKQWLCGISVFDPVTEQWARVSNDTLLTRAYGITFQDDKELVIAGGSNGKSPIRTFIHYTGDSLFISHEMLSLPKSIVLSAGGRIGMKDYIVGGTDDAANIAGVTAATHVMEAGQVSRIADYPGKPFAVAASAVVGDELFLFGGMNYDAAAAAPLNSQEAYAFSPAKNTWRKLRPLAVPTRGLCAVALDDQHIYLAGGYTNDFTALAVIYDVKSDSYAQARPLPYAAMVSLVNLSGYVYCLGGEDKKQSRTDKFYRIPLEALNQP